MVKQLICVFLMSLTLAGCFMGGQPPAEPEYDMGNKFQDRGEGGGGQGE